MARYERAPGRVLLELRSWPPSSGWGLAPSPAGAKGCSSSDWRIRWSRRACCSGSRWRGGFTTTPALLEEYARIGAPAGLESVRRSGRHPLLSRSRPTWRRRRASPPGLRPRRPVPHPAAAARVQRGGLRKPVWDLALQPDCRRSASRPRCGSRSALSSCIPFLERSRSQVAVAIISFGDRRRGGAARIASLLPGRLITSWRWRRSTSSATTSRPAPRSEARPPVRPRGDREPRLLSDDAGPARSRRERVPAGGARHV